MNCRPFGMRLLSRDIRSLVYFTWKREKVSRSSELSSCKITWFCPWCWCRAIIAPTIARLQKIARLIDGLEAVAVEQIHEFPAEESLLEDYADNTVESMVCRARGYRALQRALGAVVAITVEPAPARVQYDREVYVDTWVAFRATHRALVLLDSCRANRRVPLCDGWRGPDCEDPNVWLAPGEPLPRVPGFHNFRHLLLGNTQFPTKIKLYSEPINRDNLPNLARLVAKLFRFPAGLLDGRYPKQAIQCIDIPRCCAGACSGQEWGPFGLVRYGLFRDCSSTRGIFERAIQAKLEAFRRRREDCARRAQSPAQAPL